MISRLIPLVVVTIIGLVVTIRVSAQPPSCPSLPIWFSASYLYTNSDASLALFATGYYGVYGENEYNFHTWRLDISTNPTNEAPVPEEKPSVQFLPSSASSSSSSSLWDTTLSTLSSFSSSFVNIPLPSAPSSNYLGNYSVQSIIFEQNGSLSEHTYWTDYSNNNQCIDALIPVGDTTDGLVLNWLDQDGSPPCTDVVYIGNETINQRYYGNITVQHWSSPTTCQDIYILDTVSAIEIGLWHPAVISSLEKDKQIPLPVHETTAIPVRYTVAEGVNCNNRNRTFDYNSLEELSYYMAVQTGPLFALPLICYGNGTDNRSNNGNTDTQTMVPLVWTIVAAALSAFSGTVLGALIVRNRQLRAWRRWIQGSSNSSKSTPSTHVSVFGPSNGSIQDSYTTLSYSQRLMDVV